MVTECVYCGEKGKTDDEAGKTFHTFPLKQPKILQAWIHNMRLSSTFRPTGAMRLCSDHFEKKCLRRTGINVTLVEGSIPTLFGIYKSACVYCKIMKNPGDLRTFHRFPHKNAKQLEKWKSGMGSVSIIVKEKSLLCSDHFEKKCFRPSGCGNSLRLRDNAVPSIFMPLTFQETTAIVTEKRRSSSPEMPIAKHPHIDTEQVEQTDLLSPAKKTTESHPRSTPKRNRVQMMPDTPQRIHFTEHDHHYESTPKTLKSKLISAHQKMRVLREERKVHKQQIVRLKKKIGSLKDIVSELRRTRALSESGLACLDSIAEIDISQFLKRYMKNYKNIEGKTSSARKRSWKSSNRNPGLGISREKYPPALRSFAMTLHFYSPKAYAFVRRKFCNALPDPSTLRSWYSSINGEPGYTAESFNALKLKVSEAQSVGKEVLVSFMLDEITIKKGMQYLSNGAIRGYVNLGSDIETCGTVPLAKDALVMMAVSLDNSWKIPLGYFLIHGIDSTTNAGLISDGLICLHDIGVKVVSVTLDGPSEHFATMRALGADFSMPNPKPFFPHPSSGDKVQVIFDACHMLKLIRNCLGDFKDLKDGEGNLIQWKFITALAHLQNQEGLRAGNRLKLAHIRYWKMKMKVALAEQTLSNSVPDAIQFCTVDLGLAEFQGSEATVRFIKCIDRVFDFLNLRNPKGYKAPLRRSNEVFWRPQILAELDYVRNITDITGKPLWSTRRYVPIVGLITAAMSVIEIFDAYVKPENSPLKYLLTYKLSQDHLELFFCAIRSCGGWCPNPTCTQFVSAYKRLLVRQEIASMNGNVEAMDSTTILEVSSRASRKSKVDIYDTAVYDAIANIRVCKKYGLDDEGERNFENQDFLEEFLHFESTLPSRTLSDFSKSCVAYIGGWIVKKLVDKKKTGNKLRSM